MESESVMDLDGKGPQLPGKPGRAVRGNGEAAAPGRREEDLSAARDDERSGTGGLMEEVVHRDNLRTALKRVKQNKGSPGIDGMTVDQLPDYLSVHWLRLREDLLAGRYQPQPVRRVEIPKASGGTRQLGIPTVVDRFIQQAVLQVLQPRFDPTFSEYSYGFRPGRSAHQAVCQAQRYVQEGRAWCVDVDLEKFFDRVSHDVLMGRLAHRIEDRRVLGLIRRFLSAGVMTDGVCTERHEGTPQGGPLSPLLANVMLDEVDKELERRGHAFVRYADDCNVYVRSERAARRVMELLRKLYGALRLRVNESKSAVARAWNRKFLGYSLWRASKGIAKRTVSLKARVAFRERVRELTRRTVGQSMTKVVERLAEYLRGWKAYFRLAQTPSVFTELQGWVRHRLRALQLKQWKRGRTIYRELVARGMTPDDAQVIARNGRRWWKNSDKLLNKALPNAWFASLGLPELAP